MTDSSPTRLWGMVFACSRMPLISRSSFCSSSSAFSFSRSDKLLPPKKTTPPCFTTLRDLWAHQDSNLDRIGYEPTALAVELWALAPLRRSYHDGCGDVCTSYSYSTKLLSRLERLGGRS